MPGTVVSKEERKEASGRIKATANDCIRSVLVNCIRNTRDILEAKNALKEIATRLSFVEMEVELEAVYGPHYREDAIKLYPYSNHSFEEEE